MSEKFNYKECSRVVDLLRSEPLFDSVMQEFRKTKRMTNHTMWDNYKTALFKKKRPLSEFKLLHSILIRKGHPQLACRLLLHGDPTIILSEPMSPSSEVSSPPASSPQTSITSPTEARSPQSFENPAFASHASDTSSTTESTRLQHNPVSTGSLPLSTAVFSSLEGFAPSSTPPRGLPAYRPPAINPSLISRLDSSPTGCPYLESLESERSSVVSPNTQPTAEASQFNFSMSNSPSDQSQLSICSVSVARQEAAEDEQRTLRAEVYRLQQVNIALKESLSVKQSLNDEQKQEILTLKQRIVPYEQQLQLLQNDLQRVHAQLQEKEAALQLLQTSADQSQGASAEEAADQENPPGAQNTELLRLLQDTFQCAICLSTMSRPQLTVCCRSLLGCGDCLESAQIRNCPKCRCPIMKHSLIDVAGLDPALSMLEDA